MTRSDTHNCPICDKPFKLDDMCATDITEGPCHAACLEGSPAVDLDTGDELPESQLDTYPYSEIAGPAPKTRELGSEKADLTAWAVLDMDGDAFHSVHIFKEDAEKAAFGLGTVVALKREMVR